MVQQLTLELHGRLNGFYTVQEFWDCECDDDYAYIRLKNADDTPNHCPVCGLFEADGYPDSRLIEVLEKHPELNDVPWVYHDGTVANKDGVNESIVRYQLSL